MAEIRPSICELVITAPDPDWLRHFVRDLVADRLAASAHSFSPVVSNYRWEGKVHERVEGRASLHTRQSSIPQIVKRAKLVHPYLVPSISARPIIDGSPEYLDWIVAETRGG